MCRHFVASALVWFPLPLGGLSWFFQSWNGGLDLQTIPYMTYQDHC